MFNRANKPNGIHLVHPHPEAEQPRDQAGANPPPPEQQHLRRHESASFQSGDVVPQHGIYRVLHSQHRLPHEVTLLRGNTFPPCAKCAAEVRFELVRSVDPGTFRIALNELPEMPDIGQMRSAKDAA